jgi:hypothetical protein
MSPAEKIISQYPPGIAAITLSLRKVLLKQLKEITEQPDAAAHVIGYSYGAGYKDLICTLILSKTGTKLGFYKGAELPDPGKLLTGSGKVHRYVVINGESDIKNPALLRLVRAAVEAREKRQG